MSILLFFLIFAGNFLLVFFRKKSELIEWFSLAILVFLYGNNRRFGYSDLLTYRSAYNGYGENANQVTSFEPGYVWVTKILSKIGISFQGFLFLIILVNLLIFVYIMRDVMRDTNSDRNLFSEQSSPSYSGFIVLFCCFYLFFAMEVLRFFIATGLVLLGMYSLYKKQYIRYIAWILAAFLFHRAALFFLVFILVRKKIDVRHYGRLFLVMQILCAGIVVMGNRIPFAAEIYTSLFGGNKSVYFETATHWGFAPYFLYIYFTVLMNFACLRLMDKEDAAHRVLLPRGEDGEVRDRLYQFAVFCLKCNFFGTISQPLIILNVTQFRFTFVLSLMTFLLVSSVSGRYLVNQRKSIVRYEREELNYFLSILVVMAAWTGIWWRLKINAIGMIDALRYIAFL